MLDSGVLLLLSFMLLETKVLAKLARIVVVSVGIAEGALEGEIRVGLLVELLVVASEVGASEVGAREVNFTVGGAALVDVAAGVGVPGQTLTTLLGSFRNISVHPMCGRFPSGICRYRSPSGVKALVSTCPCAG